MKFEIFKRKAYRKNSDWPYGYEPHGGARKTTIKVVESESEAQSICVGHNDNCPETNQVGYHEWMWYEYTRISQ